MGEILVVMEHRQQELREISLQMLWKANELCEKQSHELIAVLIGGGELPFVNDIAERVNKLIIVKDERFSNHNSDFNVQIIKKVIDERKPFIVLIAHTPWGMDLAPALSIKTGLPLASDCVDILLEDGIPKVIRQVYSGKLFSRVAFKEAEGYLITVRAGAFPTDKVGDYKGEVIAMSLPGDLIEARKEFIEFVDAGAGEVDITQADLLVSIGRGIGEEENIGKVKELADKMGGTISCSRPVVDKNWLPKYHQVGTSGRTVKPKVYFALGISGAFQHVAGITGAGTVIAVNKDKKAPIFRVADYGVIDDIFKIAEALKGIL